MAGLQTKFEKFKIHSCVWLVCTWLEIVFIYFAAVCLCALSRGSVFSPSLFASATAQRAALQEGPRGAPRPAPGPRPAGRHSGGKARSAHPSDHCRNAYNAAAPGGARRGAAGRGGLSDAMRPATPRHYAFGPASRGAAGAAYWPFASLRLLGWVPSSVRRTPAPRTHRSPPPAGRAPSSASNSCLSVRAC